MNVQVKDFEVWMSQACLGKSLEKHTTCNVAKSFIKITCPCKSLRKVACVPDHNSETFLSELWSGTQATEKSFIKMTCVGTSENCMKFSLCLFVGTGN